MAERLPISSDFCRSCRGGGFVYSDGRQETCLDCMGSGWLPGCGPEAVSIPIRKVSDDDLVDAARWERRFREAVRVAGVLKYGVQARLVPNTSFSDKENEAMRTLTELECL